MERSRGVSGAALAFLFLLSAAVTEKLEAAPADSSADSLIAAATPVAQGSSAIAGTDLGATSAPPWNPPHALNPRRGWEQALLFPGRIASLPLVGLATALDHGLLWVEETALIQKAGFLTEQVSSRFGLRPGFASLGDRTGLGLRLQARVWYLPGALKNRFVIAHSASTRSYHRTEIQASGKPASVDYRYEWRPQERFYGTGMDMPEDSLANYASQFEHVKLNLTHGWNKDTPESDPRTEFSVWVGPRAMVTRTGRESGKPSIEQYFPDEVDATLDHRLEHLVYGGRFRTDWRAGIPHWSAGWRVGVEVERYDRPLEWLAMKSARGEGAQFTRTTLEAETGISFLRDPRTLRVMGKVVDQGVTSGRDHFMIADLSNLGGREGLSGFAPGRFHDMDLLLMRVAYVFPLVRRLEIELHADAGGVFPDVWTDSRVDRLETCVGIALRGRTKSSPFGSIGLDVSRETARIRYTLGRVVE